jgi:hypothetical protein
VAKYTPSKKKEAFREVIMLRTDGGLLAYLCCEGHVAQVIDVEGERLNQQADAIDEEQEQVGFAARPQVWHVIRVPFPDRVTPHDCFVCFQIDLGRKWRDIKPITRVPGQTVKP